MKIKEGFRMRKLGREFIVTAEGTELVNFNRMIVLNPTAAFLWENLTGKDFTVETMVELLLEEYEVSKETAETDAAKLADSWKEAGLVEE